MSVFKFTALPEDVGIIVAEEVVKEYARSTKNYELESKKNQEARKIKLKELSVISSIFTKPAQAELFSRITIHGVLEIKRFQRCLKSNHSLGFLVKEIDFYAPKKDYKISSEGKFAEILDRCSKLSRLRIYGESTLTDLSVLASAKGLQYQQLHNGSLRNSSNLHNFNNLTFLHLHYPTFLESSKPLLSNNFPSVTTMQLHAKTGFKKLESLLPQIRNLALIQGPVILSQIDEMENFSSLTKLDFLFTDKSNFVIQVLSRIPSNLTSIRFDYCRDFNVDWRTVLNHILDIRNQSTLKLNSIHVGHRDIKVLNDSITDEMRDLIERRGIKIETDDVYEEFEEWVERLDKIQLN